MTIPSGRRYIQRMPLDPQIAAFLEFVASAGYPPMWESTPEVARKAFRALAVDMVKPEDVVPVGSTEDTTVAGRPARVYRPVGDAGGTLLYLHGGGFVIGDLDTHDQTCRRLCRGSGVVVVALDYRLAPEHPFPAGLEDARAALESVESSLDDLGGSPLAVGGDSAGGNLAAVLAQEYVDLVDAQLLIYPSTDGAGDYPSLAENGSGYMLDTELRQWFRSHYVGAQPVVQPDDPRVSPLHGSIEDVAPALVVTAEFDPLRDEGEAYAEKLAAAGVPVNRIRYDGMIHGFLEMPAFSPAAAVAVEDLIGRFRTLLG